MEVEADNAEAAIEAVKEMPEGDLIEGTCSTSDDVEAWIDPQ
jgi:hypothetical protein